MKYKVGLTGLIGSGKSIAAKIFADLGIDVVDTDMIAHQITNTTGAAIGAILNEFGPDFITKNGELNRIKMRELVFALPEQRYKLEKILHPLIFAEVLNQLAIVKSNYVIIVVPLLFKSLKYLNFIHRSIFIDCEESVLISRVMSRSKMTANEVKLVLKAQMPRNTQKLLCDDYLSNNGNIIQLKNQIIELNNNYKKLFV